MNVVDLKKSLTWIAAAALAVVLFVPASEALAFDADHDGGGRTDPWANCASCHGGDLLGGYGPSCMDCHNDFSTPDLPPLGHNVVYGNMDHGNMGIDDRLDPMTKCTTCHGGDLTGDMGPSCFICHDDTWSGGGGGSGNSPPDINFGGPYSGAPGAVITFDASLTTDADPLDILYYLWTFSDGKPPQMPSQLPTTTHIFDDPGTYDATLTVLDGHNVVFPVLFQVVVGTSVNRPPVADASGPSSGKTGQFTHLSSAGSSDPDGDSLTYSWDFGDGSAATSPDASTTISHTYQMAGTYTATVTVDDGQVTATDSVTITITDPVDPPDPNDDDPLVGARWQVEMPYLDGAELTVTFENFAGVLFVETTHPSGAVYFGIGMETSGVIFWMDVTGAIFFGNVNKTAGTMRGVIFDYEGGSSIWFAELLP